MNVHFQWAEKVRFIQYIFAKPDKYLVYWKNLHSSHATCKPTTCTHICRCNWCHLKWIQQNKEINQSLELVLLRPYLLTPKAVPSLLTWYMCIGDLLCTTDSSNRVTFDANRMSTLTKLLCVCNQKIAGFPQLWDWWQFSCT